MELLALGPLELWQHGRQFELGSPKERCVLAVLVHARGEPVTMDALMDRVWDGEPPPTAHDTLQSYLSRLRTRLDRSVGELARVERYAPRLYQLRVDREDVDLLRFQRLRADAAAAAGQGKRDLAIGLLRTAEALWRGEPLTEFTGTWAQSARSRLVEDHRRMREERIRLELESGLHADLIGELHELAAQNPLAQQVIASLMLALYRSGRPDEALALYRTTRSRLREGQGIEPGGQLQELHLRILEQDRTLMEVLPGAPTDPDTAAPEPPAVASPADLPRDNLPRDTRDFTGRVSELRVLLGESAVAPSTTPRRHRSAPTAPAESHALPLTVIHGMPGCGKTALAIHAAHRLREAYPDGQFYVDLRAYSGQPPYDPAEALGVLLHAAGVPDRLPDSLDERAARWREWTARRRVVVVLDNALDAAQVGPLLPGASGCRAIVTSRNRLTGLNGATPLFLDVLSMAEAVALFTRVAGAARVSADADDTELRQIVEACGRHPLAVQLLASHFRHRESWGLHHLVGRLAPTGCSLDALGDEVTSAFHLSYAELSAPTRQLFRLLALHPGPDITLDAARALTGTPHDTASAATRRSVEELLDRHLLEEPVHDRYRLHDLTRAYGRRICLRDEPEPARRAALEELLDHFLTTAHEADRGAHPHRRALRLPPDLKHQVTSSAAAFADPDEASVWLTVERANLLAVARTAAALSPRHAALFPHVLSPSLKLWGAWDTAAELYEAAVTALRARGDLPALARTLVERADFLVQSGHDEALHSATEALALFQDLGDPRGSADALLQSARARLAAGDGSTALHILDEALRAYREVRDPHGEAESLNVQGVALHKAGRHREAEERFRAMLHIHLSRGDAYGQLRALNNLGEIHRIDGRNEEARAHFERSLELAHQVGGRQELANLYSNLGSVCQATGRTHQALAYFQRALSSYRAAHDSRGESDTLISLGEAYIAHRRHNEALWHFTMAEQIAGSIGNPYERVSSLVGIGTAQHHLGRYDAALEAHHEALRLAREVDTPLAAARALDGLARTAAVTQGAPAARSFATDALTLYERLGVPEQARSLRDFLVEPSATGS
ncbi:tetratricopeptide repeat protein [Streptomyces sp. MZ04]|uniref:AfsR/SARP family transcriptional regulator n=1 Tax=Streptomyces sp. MZ04 TaxID=2559236 RepID=UPI001FD86E1C|nr:tetratricopeptide repeat protein [Streptomyces sp. MZ04]